MKQFFEKLMSDDDNKKFTKFEICVYGILLPAALVLIMGLDGWLESFL